LNDNKITKKLLTLLINIWWFWILRCATHCNTWWNVSPQVTLCI